MSAPSNWNQANINEFRANAGKVGGRFEGKTLLLLHTIGAKTGRERINPVAYVRDGDRIVIIEAPASISRFTVSASSASGDAPTMNGFASSRPR